MSGVVTQADLHHWRFVGEVLILLTLSFLSGSLLAAALLRARVRGTAAAPQGPDPAEGAAASGEGR